MNELQAIINAFFEAVSFETGSPPAYERLRDLVLPSGLLINNSGEAPEVATVDEFIEPRQALVDSGELTSFAEFETHAITEVFGRVAHRLSTYGKSGVAGGTPFSASGVISTQFVLAPDGWRISSMTWDDVPLPLTGGCNCGAVRYEVSAPLVAASYCHCLRCQPRRGAAASPNAHPAPGTFRIVTGEHRLRAWKPDDGGEKWFCADCGSALFGHNSRHADPIGIRMGTFDEAPGIRPSVRQFVSSAATWEPIPDDGLPRHPRVATSRATPVIQVRDRRPDGRRKPGDADRRTGQR
jgi:hypothetical protein